MIGPVKAGELFRRTSIDDDSICVTKPIASSIMEWFNAIIEYYNLPQILLSFSADSAGNTGYTGSCVIKKEEAIE